MKKRLEMRDGKYEGKVEFFFLFSEHTITDEWGKKQWS